VTPGMDALRFSRVDKFGKASSQENHTMARQAMLAEILDDFSDDDLINLAYLLDRLDRNIASYLESDR
jgi:hypothetical protein